MRLGHVQARRDVARLLAQPMHGSEGHTQVDAKIDGREGQWQ
jgi:hypothetical protein